MTRRMAIAGLVGEALACNVAVGDASGVNSSEGGGASEGEPTTGAGTEGDGGATLFGALVSSYVRESGGAPTAVGVVIPIAAIEAAPEDWPFQDDLVLDMPPLARDRTILRQLRVNWLAHGHGPAPYSEAHFDLHFYRGTPAEIDAIDCQDTRESPLLRIATALFACLLAALAGLAFGGVNGLRAVLLLLPVGMVLGPPMNRLCTGPADRVGPDHRGRLAAQRHPGPSLCRGRLHPVGVRRTARLGHRHLTIGHFRRRSSGARCSRVQALPPRMRGPARIRTRARVL